MFVEHRADGQATIRVLDFGISKPADDGSGEALTASSGTLGSPRYMSPEQALDPRDVDARSDVWSLGISLYELWTGRPPFEGPSHLRLCKAILESTPTPPSVLRPGTPAAFEALVLRCLAKKRDERFADVAALAEALAKIDTRVAQRAASARALVSRSSSQSNSRDRGRGGTSSDTVADPMKATSTNEATATSAPVSRSSPGTTDPRPRKSALRRALVALAAIVVVSAGALVVRSTLLADDVSTIVRMPSTIVASKRPLVSGSVSTRATTAPKPTPTVAPTNHGRPADDDPLSSSH
jgi:serine/threonine-protein kinase